MIEVFQITEDLAIVTETPSWLRRVFLGEDVESRFVVRTAFGWHWEVTGQPVTDWELMLRLDSQVSTVDTWGGGE